MESTVEACIKSMARSNGTIESRAQLLFLLNVREGSRCTEVFISPNGALPDGYARPVPDLCSNAADVSAWLDKVLDQEPLRELGLALWLTGVP